MRELRRFRASCTVWRSVVIIIAAVVILMWPLCLSAQTRADAKRRAAAIDRAKNILVSSVDRNLPKVTLEFFLQQETGGAPTRWEVTDCGEQTGNPAADRGRDFPMCVEAEVSLKHRRTLTVEVLIGTASKGPFGQSAITSVTISEWDGRSKALRLSDIPTELQRPRMPEKQDLPPVVGM